MRHLRFYKETDQWFDDKWYVDLPEWTGSKADLEMVSGADSMLDMMAEGKREVYLNVAEKHLLGMEKLIFEKKADDIGNGAYYTLETYQGVKLNNRIWLCDVVLFIFNDKFPEKIYFSVST